MGLLLLTQNSFDLSSGGAGGSQTIGQYVLKLWIEIYFPLYVCHRSDLHENLAWPTDCCKGHLHLPRDNVKSGLVAGNRS
jgi:hypothetical protein